MKTQNTNVHIRLWHKDFWQMAIANLLLAMSVYCLIPVFPLLFAGSENHVETYVGLSFGAFALGMFALGGFCSYLVQRFRRNRVCILAILGVALCSFLLYYDESGEHFLSPWGIVALRFVQGALFGLSKMVLTSTLIIDTCESFARTEANHSAAWFARFAVSLGPVAGLVANALCGQSGALLVSVACAVMAALLVRLVSFPFRSPSEDVRLLSTDRFFLAKGFVLFVNLIIMSTSVGLVLSLPLPVHFFGMLMGGFMFALLAQRFAFRDAELKSEVVSGALLMIAGLLVMQIHVANGGDFFAPLLFGMGFGICASRFLLFFIKLSRHCQRGTSQSTFLLGWETGIGLGLTVGFSAFKGAERHVLIMATAMALIGLAMYVFYVHGWYIKNKNR